MIFVAGNLTDEDQILLSLVATTIGTAGAFEHQAARSVDRLKGQLDEKEGAYKISFPCDDIAVSVDGWEYQPSSGSLPGPPSPERVIAKQWSGAIPFYSEPKLR